MISRNALREIVATAYLSCKIIIFWRKTKGFEPNWERLGNNLGSLWKRNLILLVRRRDRFSLRKTKVFELSWSRVLLKIVYSVRTRNIFREMIVFPKEKLMCCQPLNNTAWKFVKACLDSKAFLAELGFRSEKKLF